MQAADVVYQIRLWEVQCEQACRRTRPTGSIKAAVAPKSRQMTELVLRCQQRTKSGVKRQQSEPGVCMAHRQQIVQKDKDQLRTESTDHFTSGVWIPVAKRHVILFLSCVYISFLPGRASCFLAVASAFYRLLSASSDRHIFRWLSFLPRFRNYDPSSNAISG